MSNSRILIAVVIALVGGGLVGKNLCTSSPGPARSKPVVIAKPVPVPARPPMPNFCIAEAAARAKALQAYQKALQAAPSRLQEEEIARYNMGMDSASGAFASAEKSYQECMSAELAPKEFFQDPCAVAQADLEKAKQETAAREEDARKKYADIDSVGGDGWRKYMDANDRLVMEFRSASRPDFLAWAEIQQLFLHAPADFNSYAAQQELRKKSAAFRTYEARDTTLMLAHDEQVERLRKIYEETKATGEKRVAAAQMAYNQCLAVHHPEPLERPCGQPLPESAPAADPIEEGELLRQIN